MKRNPVDIIMLTWNQSDLTLKCLRDIVNHTYIPFRIIWVDNGSTDAEFTKVLKWINIYIPDSYTLIRNKENTGFAKGVNQGLKKSGSLYKVILNNDVYVTDHWLTKLVEVMDNETDIGVVSPITDKISCCARADAMAKTMGIEIVGTPEKFFNSRKYGFWEFQSNISFFCALVRRDVFDSIGYLDENLFFYATDTDFNERARLKGRRTVVATNVFVYHDHHATIKHKEGLDRIKRHDIDTWRRNRAERAAGASDDRR